MGFGQLKDISTLNFSTPSFKPGPFNLRLFNHELFIPRLFNHEFFNPMVQKFMVEKSGVEKFMDEKSGVEMYSRYHSRFFQQLPHEMTA